MAGIVDTVDGVQRRYPPLGLPIAVIYKYFDDQGPYLAAIVTYYAFVALFPLLLLAATILGFVLQNDPELSQQVLDSALGQFPVIGDQLGRPEGLQGSTTVVVVGTLVALYGALGLGTAVQNAMNVAWSVPRNSRPNPFLLRLKALLILLIAGGALFAVTIASVLVRETDFFVENVQGSNSRWLVSLVTVVAVTLVLTLLFRLASARGHAWWHTIPGALLVATLWQVLQLLSTTYIDRVLGQTSSMNQTFGLVLGLIGLIFLAASIGIIGIELNVVIVRRLWPRALLTPFTDSVDLTDADRKAYTSYARAQRHKGFEEVTVVFGERPNGRVEESSEERPEVERPEERPEEPASRSD